jgi:cyclopropane fatty-acyl-phospholipid synthase-like methyltransferase
VSNEERETMNAYEAFGRVAQEVAAPTVIGGRHAFHDEDPEAVRQRNVEDVVAKLQPRSADRLLDIGCGVGFLLTPLAAHATEAVGIDHPACIARYAALGTPPNVRLIGGRWPETDIDGTFDRVLAYSVLQYLHDADTARAFIQKCIDVLRPGGRVLLGEIPNEDLRRRFQRSSFGRQVEAEWLRRKARLTPDHEVRDRIFAEMDGTMPYLTDEFVVEVLANARRQGLEAYVMPEPEGLPFCYSREDILLWRRD